MKLSTPFLLILAAVGAVEASSHYGPSRINSRHNHVARHHDDVVVKRGASGRCKVRPTSTLVSTSTTSISTHSPEPTTTEQKTTSKKPKPTAFTDNNNNSNKAADANKSGDSGKKDTSSNNPLGNFSGLIAIKDSSCGSPRATTDITKIHGPNGHIDWLNCGLENGGWHPPHVAVNDVVTVDLHEALKDPNSPFKACSPYIDTFVKYANQHAIPPIIIASIAMQESTCNPHTVGGGGEQGLMQITKDKCGGAPGGNCQDVDFNIRTGTAFFADTLNGNGGSLLKTLGNYNGWPEGMTVESATKARYSSCCLCQNNMDYLMQQVNGWFLNKDPYAMNMGKYHNLDNC